MIQSCDYNIVNIALVATRFHQASSKAVTVDTLFVSPAAPTWPAVLAMKVVAICMCKV